MAKFPTMDEMARNVAQKALEEVYYKDKSIREWAKIILSEDAISRKAVLEIFGYVMSYWKEHAIDVEPHEIEDALIKQYEFTSKKLSELPPVTPAQEWIPTSKRLPKAGEFVGKVAKYYLVQNEYGDMMVAHYTNSKWEQIFQLGSITDKIVAWRELPQPYRAESEEKE